MASVWTSMAPRGEVERIHLHLAGFSPSSEVTNTAQVKDPSIVVSDWSRLGRSRAHQELCCHPGHGWMHPSQPGPPVAGAEVELPGHPPEPRRS